MERGGVLWGTPSGLTKELDYWLVGCIHLWLAVSVQSLSSSGSERQAGAVGRILGTSPSGLELLVPHPPDQVKLPADQSPSFLPPYF